MASRGTAAWMTAEWGAACNPDLVAVPIYAGGPKFQCDRRARPAFLVLGAVFLRYGYIVRECGGYNCRPNTSNPAVKSNHSWGTAADFNPDTNPYRRDKVVTDMPGEMIAEIEAIKTTGGVTVFRWGGHYTSVHDAMHFEVMATPGELAAGIPADVGHPAVPTSWPVIRRGAIGSAVIELQRLLVLGNTTGVGEFGPRTEAAVKLYQSRRGLTPDGIVGAATWTALHSNMPPLTPGTVGPLKTLVNAP